MIENYNILKENNLRQMVTEYENKRPDFVKEKQYCHNLMKYDALKQLEVAVQEDEKQSSLFWQEIDRWTTEFYNSVQAGFVRKYAAIYDSKNLEKYRVSNPLLPMEYDDIMGEYVRTGYFPFVNTTLRSLTTKHTHDYQR